jgi:para-nitrobenzyl esterase
MVEDGRADSAGRRVRGGDRLPTSKDAAMTGHQLIVDSSAGKLAGLTAGGVATFLGIPYGDSVSGERRFTAPQPHPPWPGVREAAVFGPAAPQTDPRIGSSSDFHAVLRLLYPGVPSPLEGRAMGEDALVLNVWASTAETGPKPVMVWLHGGGFVHGTGAEGWFHGDRLAARGDVVVVTVNHRLGVLGFLPVSDELGEDGAASSVAGMLDIVLALRWVQENIGAFGGDAGNVTVFGQSGGGMKVSALMAMPSARGLFHKAIVQSGPGIRVVEQADADRNLARLLTILDVESAAQLRGMDIAALLRGQSAAMRGLTWGPVLHHEELPRHPFLDGADPHVDGIPLLIGTATHEAALFFAEHAWYHGMRHADLASRFASELGDDSGELLEFYRDTADETIPQLLLARARTDVMFGSSSVTLADTKARQSAPVFGYRLDYRTEVLGGVLGAHHSLDLPLVFDNADRSPTTGQRPERLAVAAEMASAWARFARVGSPAGGNVEEWAQYEPGGGVLVFGDRPGFQTPPELPASARGLSLF